MSDKVGTTEAMKVQQPPSRQSRHEAFIPSRVVNITRKVYHPLGFKKGYNFFLFVITCGALVGFILARFKYLDVDGRLKFSAIPSDAVDWTTAGYKRIGIFLHMVGILFGGFFAVFQFVPAIRYKAILFHRINGYFVSLLLLIGLAGGFMIISTAAGGHTATQAGLGVLGSSVAISWAIAYYNIKKLRIDLHREWMIRSWVYAASIITLRLIQLCVLEYVVDRPNYGWYDVQYCSSIYNQYRLYGAPDDANPTVLLYPSCNTTDPDARAVVNAVGDGPENGSARAHITFGLCLWLALLIHAICVEVYFRLTQSESERLRKVSKEKRMEAGYSKKEKPLSDESSFPSDSN